MKVLFIEPRVNNPVRINIALPMAFLSLYSYAKPLVDNIEFFYHSLEIDHVEGRNDSFESIFNKYVPDIVLSTAVSCNFNNATNILKFFKEKKCITMIGGLFPSANDRWVLDNFKFIDIVFRGEGEQSFVEVLRKIKSGDNYKTVKGISFWNNGTIISNSNRDVIQDLNNIPQTLYDRIPIRIYKNYETRYYVFASRGCSFSCEFCTLTAHWQNKHRKCSVERVLKETEQIVNLFSPSQISFGDDTLSLDKLYFRNLCEALSHQRFPVHFGGKTRIDLIDCEHLELMRKAGFRELSFGIESNDKNQLKILNKVNIFSALANIENILNHASELGFRINLNFILGTPGETNESLNRKALFIIKHCSTSNIIPLLGFFTPHRGTKLYEKASEIGIRMIDHNYDNYNHLKPVCVPASLGPEGLTLLKQTYNLISTETGSVKYNPLLEE